MSAPSYTVPDAPADPEAAALELIVRVPADMLGHDSIREALQEFATLLAAADTFAGMSWYDAKHAATAIMFDAISRDNAGAFLRYRATLVATGAGNCDWNDRDAMVRALTTAADVISSAAFEEAE